MAQGRPAYAILRQDEDWSSLADAAKRTDSLDRFKYIPLNDEGTVYLSTAIDSYFSYRGFQNELNGVFPGYDGTWNTRLNLHASLCFGVRTRVYAALKHGDVYSRETPPISVNRDRLDLHQAFVEEAFGDLWGGAAKDGLLRVGRQEIHYGTGSLISARLGPNVRSNYDGILARVRKGRVVSDAFVYRAVRDRFAIFDDKPERNEKIWGSYTTIGARRANVDLIYIGQRHLQTLYATVAGPVNETRHTMGARVWSNGPLPGGLSVDFEGDYQVGRAKGQTSQNLEIRAWSLVGTLSHPFPKKRFRPSAGVEFGVNSGDANPNDRTLGTFRAPAPPGRYFGEANSFGPGNIAGFRPFIEFNPLPALRIRTKTTLFWRREASDGIYTLAPTVLRAPVGDGLFLGAEPGLEIAYVFGPHVNLLCLLAHFQASRFFDTNPRFNNVNYAEVTLNFRL